MFITNKKDQVTHKRLPNVEILIHPLTVLQIVVVFSVIVVIAEI